MKKTMTIKEISDLCGFKSSKTILKWIKEGKYNHNENGQILTIVSQKLTRAQKEKKAAEFYLDEVLAIIRAGGNETLVSLLKDNAEKSEIKNESDNIEMAIERGIKAGIQAVLPFLEKLNIKEEKKAELQAIENKTDNKNYKYLTLKLIGDNLKPKLKPSQVGRMLFELGYAVQLNNSFVPSFRCNSENRAVEQKSIYGGFFYAWDKDFIETLQVLLNKETNLF